MAVMKKRSRLRAGGVERAGKIEMLERKVARRPRVAIHEAGHAAMALILGAKLYRVTIKPTPKRPPHTLVRGGSPSAEILINLAGGIAEGIRYREKLTCGEGDLDQTLQYINLEGVRHFAVPVAKLLRLHWPGVLAVAAALENADTLSGKEVEQVFVDGLVRRKPRRRRATSAAGMEAL